VAARLKVDENLPGDVADVLAADGYDALTVGDQGWEGTADGELWRRIQAEGRWLVTADKEFGNLRRYPAGTHAGVILLRSAEESRDDYSRLAEILVQRVKLDEIAGAVIVVNRRGVRIRRA
jgi:predicted nuclease of predicted toxin-antitoxin system